jgi:hypothetical protein
LTLPKILDGLTKEGEEYFSEEEEDGEGIYGEEGEEDLYELDSEEIEELKRQGITPEEYLAGRGQFDDEDGEEELEYGDEDG